jgi:hypothetical protein
VRSCSFASDLNLAALVCSQKFWQFFYAEQVFLLQSCWPRSRFDRVISCTRTESLPMVQCTIGPGPGSLGQPVSLNADSAWHRSLTQQASHADSAWRSWGPPCLDLVWTAMCVPLLLTLETLRYNQAVWEPPSEGRFGGAFGLHQRMWHVCVNLCRIVYNRVSS